MYPSDLNDKQWAKISEFFKRPDPRGAKPKHATRTIVNAILYVTKSGCQWRMLPQDFPPWKTVYDHFRNWCERGIWEKVLDTLNREVRVKAGRAPSPISYAGFGKLRFKLECEQELWAECSRLIANCIIFYNASLLSRLLEHQESIGDTRGAEATKKVCPVAWQHINLQGRFEFLKIPDILNVDAIIQRLTSPHAGRVVNLFP